MKPPVLTLVGLVALVAVFHPPTLARSQETAAPWEAFQIETLERQREASGRPYLEFLTRRSMSAGLYTLPATGRDRQRPHQRDEVYYVVRGRATLEVGAESQPVAPGSIVFVRAGVPHRFVDIAETLAVVVVFVNAKSEIETAGWQEATVNSVTSARDSTQNVWNVFFDLPTLRFGMYMLPERLDGDRTLTHRFDEINLVVAGRARFHVGAESLDVGPGSIVFVEAGVGHSFDALEDDFDVLILWEREVPS